MTLADGAGSTVVVTSNGAFAFPVPVTSGSAYAVTITAQPTSPTQTCTVTNGSGTVATTNVTSIAVACTTLAYTVGGTVTGLSANDTLVLADNGGDTLPITANGPFTFATPVKSGAAYAVTVLTQPGKPAQTCVIRSGTGTVAHANVTGVTVACTTDTFVVGGTLSGLAASDTVVLQDNGSGSLTVSTNGTFSFTSRVASGAAYAVTVLTQPSTPRQTCIVSGGTGVVGASNVTSVNVNCATNAYSVGGTITGIVGTVILTNEGGDALAVSSVGSFAFTSTVPSGSAYAVAVKTQPANPAQTCVVAGGSGTVTNAPITSVVVTCTTNTYAINVTVSGLASAEQVVLQDNGGDNLTVSANATATFATAVPSGQPYAVTVLTSPASPITQTCVVTNGTGNVGSASVTVAVTCTTNTYTVSGTVSGLGANDSLTLENNAHDALTRTTNGSFTFATAIPSGGTYAVTVSAQPGSPIYQTCTVTSGSGSVTNAPITNVAVACTTNTYTVSATVAGLAANESVVLQDNGGDNLAVTANGTVTFATSVASGNAYLVTVLTNPGTPEYQTCTVTGQGGTVMGGNVSSVSVNCADNTYTIGGTVSGLSGTVVLQDNGGASLSLTANGAFAFTTPVASDHAYAVTVLSNPTAPVQVCSVSAGSGTVTDTNVTSVAVSCVTSTFTVGGNLTGLGSGDTVTLEDNAGNALNVTANGSFTFTKPVASGMAYAVTVTTSPSAPISQTCAVSMATASGQVTNANVTSVAVSCTTNRFTIGGTLSGLPANDSVTLLDNGGNALALTTNGAFTFTTAIASGQTYAVTVGTAPTAPVQVCAVSTGTGTVGAGNVTSVNVVCTPHGGSEGALCTLDSDCSQGYCSVLTNSCVAGQSCKAAQPYTTLGTDHAGIDSCGTGESTDPAADQAHESCCRSLLLPSGTDSTPMRMDKYEVTTGRMRQFVQAINGLENGYNLRAWALAQVSAGTPAGVALSAQMSNESLNFLPSSNDPSTPLNLPAQLGATSMDANVPSESQGCYMADGAYGAGAYWQPAATLTAFGSPARSFAQGDYDIKSMNCGTYWVYAAFCAWDGGRLPTLAEVEAVWGSGQYPWTSETGASAPFWPSPYPYTTVTTKSGTNYYANIPSPSVQYTVNWNNSSFEGNPGDFYFFPNLGSLTDEPAEVDNGTDLTPFIAAPGRFPLDVTSTVSTSFAGTEGWRDLAANMIEITAESAFTGSGQFCDCATYTSAELSTLTNCTCPSPGSTPDTKPGVVRSTDLPNAPWVGGSWEGHEDANPAAPPYFAVHSYDKPLQTQYGKAGFRCVRPAP